MLLFPREIGLRRSQCFSRKTFDDYIDKVNGKASCYTSLYAFQRKDPTRPWKYDVESVIMDRAWWDFDIEEGGSMDDVKNDVATLISRLDGDVRTVFTGRGFHIHQMFKRPVIGTSIARHIDRYERSVASDLATLDGVGHPQKLTRIPNTYNTKRSKWAVNIPTLDFIKDPLNYDIPTTPNREYDIYDPFRGRAVDSEFDIVKWISNNPIPKDLHSNVFHGEITSSGQIPIPPCIASAMTHENPKHPVRLALGYHLVENLRLFADPKTLTTTDKRKIVDEAVAFIEKLNWRDFKPSMSRMQLFSIIDHEQPPSCSWLSANVGCKGSCWRDDGTRRV